MIFLIKTILSALVIAGVSELAKKYSLLAALLASLPLTSILAFVWLYWVYWPLFEFLGINVRNYSNLIKVIIISIQVWYKRK